VSAITNGADEVDQQDQTASESPHPTSRQPSATEHIVDTDHRLTPETETTCTEDRPATQEPTEAEENETPTAVEREETQHDDASTVNSNSLSIY